MDCSKEAPAGSTKTNLRNELFGNIFSRGWMNQSSKEAPIHLVGYNSLEPTTIQKKGLFHK